MELSDTPGDVVATTTASETSNRSKLGRVNAAQFLWFAVSVLFALALGFCIAGPLVGLAAGALAYFTSDPHCGCYAQKLYLARGTFENYIPAIKVLCVVGGLVLAIPIWRLVRTRIGFVSVVFGLLAGLATWHLYEWLLDINFQKSVFLRFDIASIVATHHQVDFLFYLDELFKWKFACAFLAFLVISISSGLIAKSIKGAEAQE
jgi:hypothetical protein